jgi:hypothetical protein
MSVVHNLDALQGDVNAWFANSAADANAMFNSVSAQLAAAEQALLGGAPAAAAAPALSMAAIATPQKQSTEGHVNDMTGMASPPVSHALNYDALIDEVEQDTAAAPAGMSPAPSAAAAPFQPQGYALQGGVSPHDAFAAANRSGDDVSRPTREKLPHDLLNVPAPSQKHQLCHVMVEFKRERSLQFDSPMYVAPGEYVVVGGDRGEDIGLVTYSWLVAGGQPPPAQVAKWAGVGVGKVVRIATVLEVSQLQGVQSELENRAKEVAQQKVLEHQLPMRIVDAEYKFDRKKLTFFYQSQHRLDFRNLVRDLYKTFRARIWMELD